MTPKFNQLLETCIMDGVERGHKRAYKHNDAPDMEEINDQIVKSIIEEIYEWFDFNEEKNND